MLQSRSSIFATHNSKSWENQQLPGPPPRLKSWGHRSPPVPTWLHLCTAGRSCGAGEQLERRLANTTPQLGPTARSRRLSPDNEISISPRRRQPATIESTPEGGDTASSLHSLQSRRGLSCRQTGDWLIFMNVKERERGFEITRLQKAASTEVYTESQGCLYSICVYSIPLLHCMYGLRCDNLLLNEYMMMMMMLRPRFGLGLEAEKCGLGLIDVMASASYSLASALESSFMLFLCVPARSAAVERVFSQSGLVMRPNRARMSDYT